MKIRVSVTLALRFLGIGSGKTVSNARKSLLGAIAGIGISLVPLVIVLVVADGMIEGISARIIELSSSHIRAADYSGITGIGADPAQMEKLADQIVASDTTGLVSTAQAERQGMGIVIGKKGRSGATVRAIEPDFFSSNPAVKNLVEIVDGKTVMTAANDAYLGKKLASDLGLKVGDTFRILTMRKGLNGNAIPQFSTCTVKAVISSGYQELDALWVFIPLRLGYKILSPDSSTSFINIRTNDAFGNLEPLRSNLMRTLPEGFSVYTWKEMNRSQFQSFTTTRTLLLFIMLLIVFVASVNVSSALVMLVMERRREIAILKSTGASPSGITFAFLLAGFFTGFGGLVVGIPIGLLCAVHINELFSSIECIINGGNRFLYILSLPSGTGRNAALPAQIHLLDPAYYLEKIPVHLDSRELFIIAAGTLVLSVLVSILPAIRAGQEKPLDTLRKF